MYSRWEMEALEVRVGGARVRVGGVEVGVMLKLDWAEEAFDLVSLLWEDIVLVGGALEVGLVGVEVSCVLGDERSEMG